MPPLETLKPEVTPNVRSASGGDTLKPKERRFVEEYLIDLNASAAYLRAGYKGDKGGALAGRLIGKDRVRRAIELAIAARSKRVHVDQDRVITGLAHIAFADRRQLFERREAVTVTPEQLYNACRNTEWTLPFAQLSPAEQAAWTAAAEQANTRQSGGYFLKSPDDIPDDLAAVIEGVEVVTKSIGDGQVEYLHKIHFSPRLPAQVALGKHLGLFHDKGDPRNPRDKAIDESADDSTLLGRLRELVAKADAPNGTDASGSR